MHQSSEITRRSLMGTAAAMGGAAFVGQYTLAIEADQKETVVGETKHFHYRLASSGPYIDTQRGSKAFGFADDAIYLSTDTAKTWAHQSKFPHASNITFSVILKNGNILFATLNKLYLSTDNLHTYKQIAVKDQTGNDYPPHKPLDPGKPGWYFHPLDGVHTWEIDGKEILVWGNYTNVLGGAAPVNIYYSTDGAQTVKLAYRFGVSPRWQQKNVKADQLLGDPDNPVIARHIHSVVYNPDENAFYACTGDHDEKDGDQLKHECHWLRGTYDWASDKWDWQVVISGSMNSRYKSGGINFVDGQLYWASDANGPKPHDRGIFRCAPEDLADKSKHTMLFNPTYEVANMLIEDGVILSGHYTPVSPYHVGIIISPDLGKTWAQYDLKGMGRWSPVRFQKKNDEGWFRIDLRERWIKRGKVLFIKPKI
jgi:hypothetical protein